MSSVEGVQIRRGSKFPDVDIIMLHYWGAYFGGVHRFQN